MYLPALGIKKILIYPDLGVDTEPIIIKYGFKSLPGF